MRFGFLFCLKLETYIFLFLPNIYGLMVCRLYSRLDSNLMQEFPPTSKLDPKVYGDQNSTITKEKVEKSIDGLSIKEVKVLVSVHLEEDLG